LPRLQLDNREIVGARLVSKDDIRRFRLTGPVKTYVEQWLELTPVAVDL
jgi:8-oxo-dGTP diphosphatase